MSAPRGRDRAPPPPPPPPPPLLLLPPRRLLLLLQTLLLRGAPRRALRHQRPARLLPSAAPSGLWRRLVQGSWLTTGRPGVLGRLAARLSPGAACVARLEPRARSLVGAPGCTGPGVSTLGPEERAAAARTRHGRSVWAPAGSCLLLRVSLAVRIAASHHWRRPGRFLRAGGEGAGGRGRARARAGTMRMRGPGAPPSGRGRTGAQLAWVRLAHIKGGPARLPACRGLSTASSFSWRLRLEGGAQTLGGDRQLRRGRARETEAGERWKPSELCARE